MHRKFILANPYNGGITLKQYAIGLDFGTLSVRALLMDIETGDEIAVSVFEYPHGVMETTLPSGKRIPDGFALQHPQDYIDGLIFVVRNVLESSMINPANIVGIGIDFTASTVFPVKADGTPLCMLEAFINEPHAYVKLWKHHGAEPEAQYIESVVKERGESWIDFCGGKVSSEWMLPKVLETLNHAPQVYESAYRYIEAMDWITWILTGQETRSINGAGYKAFYNDCTGYPSKEFCRSLDIRVENYTEDKLNAPIKKLGETAGYLTSDMANTLGLHIGTPIGVPMIDAHCGVLGGGVTKPGEMMLVIGTSFAHHMMSEKDADVYGICAQVKDGILPGYYAYEAGQSGGGDIYAWFIENCIPEKYEIEAREKGIGIHQLLCEKLQNYRIGQSGLIALDWFNGVRSPLTDFDLNGLVLGMNLQTKPEDIYMALIEATGFGTRMIVGEFEKAGISIESIVMSGGIPLKNPMLVQIYADILNREIRVCQTTQAGAVGAAILGVAAAPSTVTGYKDLVEVAETLGKKGDKVYLPNSCNVDAYAALYHEYITLHEYFGKGTNDVMKRLNKMRRESF